MFKINPLKSQPQKSNTIYKSMPPQEPTIYPDSPQPQNQPEALEPPLNISSPPDLPDHFDELLTAPPAPPNMPPSGAAVMLRREDFQKLFITGFQIAHNLTKLQSLKVEPQDAAALECAVALYDCITDIPALHFMLYPGNKWLERAMVIGVFTVPMAINLNRELQQRHNPKYSVTEPLRQYHDTSPKAAAAQPVAEGGLTDEQRAMLVR